MEAIVLKAVTRELAHELPARVHAVWQTSPRELVLVVRGRTESRLLISADPEFPRLHLIGPRPPLLPAPTAFCRLLRKRLEGRVLAGIACPGVERSVRLTFAAHHGSGGELLLIAELMGKHSNLILVEAATGLIVDALQHVAPPMSRVRTVLAGLPYTPPPASGRAALDTLDAPAFAALWRESSGSPEALFRGVLGLGPGQLALAVGEARLAPGFDTDPGTAVHTALVESARRVESGSYQPVSYPDRGILLPLPVSGWEAGPRGRSLSMNATAEEFYAQRVGLRIAQRRRGVAGRELRRRLKRVAAEEMLRREESGAEDVAALLQAAADGLAQVAASVQKGATVFSFADPRTGERAEVPLDPALGPRQNVEALYRRARKIRRRATLAAQKLPALAARRRVLEDELARVAALPPEALGETALSAAPSGASAKRAAQKAPPGIREYRYPEGWRILVGKSGPGNDRLTGKIAAPEDYWFHVRDFPGAHVVLKGAGAEPSEAAIRAAGEVAAWHSGARSERVVDVAYTRRKNVRKIKGGEPGAVTLGDSATVRVHPGIPGAVEGLSA